MITIFNCGQGDAAYISDLNLLVDLGRKNQNIEDFITSSNPDLMISHSHDDHIKGFQFSKNTSVGKLFLPAYLPECLVIINKLLGKENLILPDNVDLLYEGQKIFNDKVTPSMPR